MAEIIKPIVATIVRALIVWFLGILAAKSPTLYNLANTLIGQVNGGVETMVLSISGLVVVLAIAIWARLKAKLKLKIALDSPKGTSLETVNAIAKETPTLSVISDPPR